MVRVWIALGSNLGDRARALAGALTGLARTPGLGLVATSHVYETDPIGPPPQGPYLNAVAELSCELDALDLLQVLHAVERAAGRERSGAVRWSARTLDLDLLLYGDRCIETAQLVVPHPRLHERAFVLVPLVEIARAVRHPRLERTIGELHAALAEREGVRRWSDAPLAPLEEDEPWPSPR